MPRLLRRRAKEGLRDLGSAAAMRLDRRCRFDRTVFVLAHMRCGSTALSNVLCHHPEVCGFGESHLVYRSESTLGRLLLETVLERAWKPRFRFLFDKVLWNHLDGPAPSAFFCAKAVFTCRAPEDTIASLLNLATVDPGVADFDLARSADYYEGRMERLLSLWETFPPENRVGFTYEELVAAPNAVLERVVAHLGLGRPLVNAYATNAVRWRPGVGDPLALGAFGAIVAKPSGGDRFRNVVQGLPSGRRDTLNSLYCELRARTAAAATGLAPAGTAPVVA